MNLRRPTSQPPRIGYSSQAPSQALGQASTQPTGQGSNPTRLSPEQAAKNRPALTRPD
jgi:hypothetical protein